MIYNKPNITTGVQLDKCEALKKNISVKNPKKVKQEKRTGGRFRSPHAAQQQWDDNDILQAAPTTIGRGKGAAKQNKMNKQP